MYYILNSGFFRNSTFWVGRNLLGKILVRETKKFILKGRIVEVEVYDGFYDLASHASKGKTNRNFPMFGPPGFSYIYQVHTHWCLNIVTRKINYPAAVLIRAIEPVEGIKTMCNNRNSYDINNLTNGPGKLTQAMEIDGKLNNYDMTTGKFLWIEGIKNLKTTISIVSSKRVGIDYAKSYKNKLWRFYIKNNPYVSRL